MENDNKKITSQHYITILSNYVLLVELKCSHATMLTITHRIMISLQAEADAAIQYMDQEELEAQQHQQLQIHQIQQQQQLQLQQQQQQQLQHQDMAPGQEIQIEYVNEDEAEVDPNTLQQQQHHGYQHQEVVMETGADEGAIHMVADDNEVEEVVGEEHAEGQHSQQQILVDMIASDQVHHGESVEIEIGENIEM